MTIKAKKKPYLPEGRVALHIRSITPELRKRFKLWCVKRNQTMEEATVELITEAVRT